MRKETIIAIVAGSLLVFAMIIALNPFYEKYHFLFRSPVTFHVPVRLEKRRAIEVIKYIVVTHTPSPYPKFRLEGQNVK